jgi:hypothetical protein
VFWYHAVLFAVLIGAVALYGVHPSAPREPWWHRLVCVVPLSLLVGVVLSVFSS